MQPFGRRGGVASGWMAGTSGLRGACRREHRGRGQARRVLAICCRVYSYMRRGRVSVASKGILEKDAYEGSVSVIRCGKFSYQICVAVRGKLKRVMSFWFAGSGAVAGEGGKWTKLRPGPFKAVLTRPFDPAVADTGQGFTTRQLTAYPIQP